MKKKIAAGLLVLAVVVALVIGLLCGGASDEEPEDKVISASELAEYIDSTESLDSIEETASTKDTEALSEGAEDEDQAAPTMLLDLEPLYAQNQDLAGWIRIEDTVVDYPVMHTPEDGEKYIYADFEGNFDVAGLPFLKDVCSMDPESDNLIIYGHNMKNGTMFASLMEYAEEAYWKAHPVIQFSTLYEEREYEIVAAFYDRVYYKHEDCFKFYQFIDAADEAHFEEAMTYYQEKALYDTGVTAEYGDRLLTLVTCAYHIENGRFVVVARAPGGD